MPEGDTIFRTARTLHRALAGRAVERFESVFPQLTRVDADRPVGGRTIDRVTSHGKNLLMSFSGDLVLRTHMRMNGSWHIYRVGERWQRPRHEMRIVLVTDVFEAVAFNVPVAEFGTAAAMKRELAGAGPDLLADNFDPAVALSRLRERRDIEIADALLDQKALAGIGNVYKSEVLFASAVNPFVRVADLADDALEKLIATAMKFMRANVSESSPAAIVTHAGLRSTTPFGNPAARLWVYGRVGKPCRRCGTPISRVKQGPNARSTYWCEKCQARATAAPA